MKTSHERGSRRELGDVEVEQLLDGPVADGGVVGVLEVGDDVCCEGIGYGEDRVRRKRGGPESEDEEELGVGGGPGVKSVVVVVGARREGELEAGCDGEYTLEELVQVLAVDVGLDRVTR